LCHFGSNEQAKTPIKNPKWINELHKKQKFIDLVMKLTLFIFVYADFVLDANVPFQFHPRIQLFWQLIAHLLLKESLTDMWSQEDP
jgi:hypothetical protein